jgi:hypothetical protein
MILTSKVDDNEDAESVEKAADRFDTLAAQRTKLLGARDYAPEFLRTDLVQESLPYAFEIETEIGRAPVMLDRPGEKVVSWQLGADRRGAGIQVTDVG